MTATVIGRHPYEAVADDLRQQIRDRAYGPGVKLPSEKELSGRYGVARTTVRNALQLLIAEGLVQSVPTVGHMVREHRPLIWVASRPDADVVSGGGDEPGDVWHASVREQGRRPSEQLHVEKQPASEDTAVWLGIEPGETVAVRRRLRSVDGFPSSIADSYYPLSVVAGTAIEEPADIRPGVYAVFRTMGLPWVDTRDRIIARGPTPDETHSLRIPRGVQVTHIVRRSWIEDGRCVRVTHFVLPRDRHEIEYHHPRAEVT